MIHFKSRKVLSFYLLFGLVLSLVSCSPRPVQEESVAVPPSYEQYSKQELLNREQAVQEDFDRFTEDIFRDSSDCRAF